MEIKMMFTNIDWGWNGVRFDKTFNLHACSITTCDNEWVPMKNEKITLEEFDQSMTDQVPLGESEGVFDGMNELDAAMAYKRLKLSIALMQCCRDKGDNFTSAQFTAVFLDITAAMLGRLLCDRGCKEIPDLTYVFGRLERLIKEAIEYEITRE